MSSTCLVRELAIVTRITASHWSIRSCSESGAISLSTPLGHHVLRNIETIDAYE